MHFCIVCKPIFSGRAILQFITKLMCVYIKLVLDWYVYLPISSHLYPTNVAWKVNVLSNLEYKNCCLTTGRENTLDHQHYLCVLEVEIVCK